MLQMHYYSIDKIASRLTGREGGEDERKRLGDEVTPCFSVFSVVKKGTMAQSSAAEGE